MSKNRGKRKQAKQAKSNVPSRTSRPPIGEISFSRGPSLNELAAAVLAPYPVPEESAVRLSAPETIEESGPRRVALDVVATEVEPREDAELSSREQGADEVSIPPVVGELDERFFASDERHAHDVGHEEEIDPRSLRKMTPAARARRAHLARYVMAAVGLSAVVCLAAVARKTLTHRDGDFVATTSFAGPAFVQPATLVESPKVDEPIAQAAAPIAPKAEAPQAAVVAPVAEAPKAEAIAPVAEVKPEVVAAPEVKAEGAKTAGQEKAAARTSLERGNATMAIEAGERSVALDPTDGDAWLILGAAYQDKGKLGEARRCFTQCVKQGKKGSIGECRALL